MPFSPDKVEARNGDLSPLLWKKDGSRPRSQGWPKYRVTPFASSGVDWPSIPALIIPDMVPTHGALNAFGFVLCAHLARGREITSP